MDSGVILDAKKTWTPPFLPIVCSIGGLPLVLGAKQFDTQLQRRYRFADRHVGASGRWCRRLALTHSMEKWDSVSKFGYVKSSTQWVAHQQHTSIEPLTRPQRKCRRNIASSANHAKRPGFDRYFGLNVVQMISMFHRCLQLSVADLFWAGHLVHDCNIPPSFPDPGAPELLVARSKPCSPRKLWISTFNLQKPAPCRSRGTKFRPLVQPARTPNWSLSRPVPT